MCEFGPDFRADFSKNERKKCTLPPPFLCERKRQTAKFGQI